MKIEFGNKKDYIEISRNENKEIVCSISAQDRKDRLKSNVNSASVSLEEFERLINSSLSKEEIQKILDKKLSQ
jgi:hypothetical protein